MILNQEQLQTVVESLLPMDSNSFMKLPFFYDSSDRKFSFPQLQDNQQSQQEDQKPQGLTDKQLSTFSAQGFDNLILNSTGDDFFYQNKKEASPPLMTLLSYELNHLMNNQSERQIQEDKNQKQISNEILTENPSDVTNSEDVTMKNDQEESDSLSEDPSTQDEGSVKDNQGTDQPKRKRNVQLQRNREENIYIQRGIFRINKQFWGKIIHTSSFEKYKAKLFKLLESCSESQKNQLKQLINDFKNCKSISNIKQLEKKGVKVSSDSYTSLVGDPCYHFSQEAKNIFMKNVQCSFLFLIAGSYMKKKLPTQKNYNERKTMDLLSELQAKAKRSLRKDNQLFQLFKNVEQTLNK